VHTISTLNQESIHHGDDGYDDRCPPAGWHWTPQQLRGIIVAPQMLRSDMLVHRGALFYYYLLCNFLAFDMMILAFFEIENRPIKKGWNPTD